MGSATTNLCMLGGLCLVPKKTRKLVVLSREVANENREGLGKGTSPQTTSIAYTWLSSGWFLGL